MLLCIVCNVSSLESLEAEDTSTLNKVGKIGFRDGRLTTQSYDLPSSAYSWSPPSSADRKPDTESAAVDPADPVDKKIHHKLKDAGAVSNEAVQVVISFKEEVKMPSMRGLNRTHPQFHAQAEAKVQQIKAFRESRFGAKRAMLNSVQANVHEMYWLINAVFATIPRGAVRRLAEFAEVSYIEPADDGSPPPQDGNFNNDVADGRRWLNSDPYRGYSTTSNTFIGLLDTGVRASHQIFTNPDRIDYLRTCDASGCTSSVGGNVDCWNHGTSTAAIIMGNANFGNDFTGVTDSWLDSYKVYPSSTDCVTRNGLSIAAAVSGFQLAALYDHVIVAEMQGGGGDTGALSTAADAAFDAGRIVIAANGNTNSQATVAAPASAHKVIGVGSFNVNSGLTTGSDSVGPAPDGRIKPDIRTPTLSETASAASNTAFQVFSGTSGATPYAGAAAALVHNWLSSAIGLTEPGHTYAALIAYTDGTSFDNTNGAGRLSLGINGWFWGGKVQVTSTGQTINIPISTLYTNRIQAAIWWPETPSTHNDIDLRLINPSGVQVGGSASIASVFEKANYASPVTGSWTLRIYGYNVVSSQYVYWAFFNN